MFKFLRKYNKWILAVGGTLLLIVFLIPEAITTLAQRAARGGSVWATVGKDDEELPLELRAQCASEVELLMRLGAIDRSLPITRDPDHWYLLVREAEQQGLLGANPRNSLPAESLAAFYSLADNRTDMVDEVIGKRLAIQRMSLLYQNSGKLSDVRMREEAERIFHGVDARMIVLLAEPDEDAPAPTEAELQAHYEKYRDVEPGADSTFGYRLPDRFKIEWMRIDEPAVRAMIEKEGAVDPVALYRHWQRNDKTAEVGAEKRFPPFVAGEAIPDVVRTDLLDQLTATRMEEIERFINEQLYENRRRLTLRDAYYVLPEDWASRRLNVEALARQVRDHFEGLPLPTYEAVGDRWLTIDDLSGIKALSGTETRGRTTTPKPIATLVASAREFGAGDPAVILQEGVVGPMLRDRADDSLVLFRLLATDPARPPASLDEVREAVTSDLRRTSAYDRLLARAGELETRAETEGLVALGMELGEPVVRGDRLALQNMGLVQLFIQQNMPLRDSPSPLPVLGEHSETLRTIIDRSLELPRDKPLTEVPVAERTFVVPVGDRLAMLIVELTRQYPLTREQYAQLAQSNSLQFLMISGELSDVRYGAQEAFQLEALAARHNFKLKTRDTGEEKAEEGAGPTASAESSSGG